MSLEHEVELARFCEGALAAVRTVIRVLQVVGAKSLVTVHALDERVSEGFDVPRGLPDAGMHDDRRLQADDVVPQLDNVPPPEVSDVAAQCDAVGAVVVQRVDATVDLAGLIDEATAFAQRHDLLHQLLAFEDHLAPTALTICALIRCRRRLDLRISAHTWSWR